MEDGGVSTGKYSRPLEHLHVLKCEVGVKQRRHPRFV